jgi:hypothetical protein
VPVGTIVTSVSAFLEASSTTYKASRYIVTISKRLTADIDVDNKLKTGSSIWVSSKLFDYSDLGLVLDGGGKDITIPIDSFKIDATYTYYVTISGLSNTLNGTGALGYAYNLETSQSRQRRKGWTYSGTSASDVTTPYSAYEGFVPASLRLGVSYQEPKLLSISESAIAFEHITKVYDADITASSFDVTYNVKISRNFSRGIYEGTNTLIAASVGKSRYDILYINIESGQLGYPCSISVVSGTERDGDTAEFIESTESLLNGNQIPIAYLRVSDTDIEVLECWDLYSGNIPELLDVVESDKTRNRDIFAHKLGAISRGGALSIDGIGDSILEAGSGGGSISSPNGANRDMLSYFQPNIGADVTSSVSLFTAVELGMADDGAGSIHTKRSFAWTFVDEIRKLGGYTLGTDLFFNNWGISSKKISDTYTAGTASAWLINFCVPNADVVIMNFGMNDFPGLLSNFYSEYVGAIEYIKSNKQDSNGDAPKVIVIGTARPNVATYASSMGRWYEINKLLRYISYKTNSVFIDVVPYYSDEYSRASHISNKDMCSANGGNHPGLYEHSSIIGRAIINQTVRT